MTGRYPATLVAAFVSISFFQLPAAAGPNADGVIILHAESTIAYSSGAGYCGQSSIASCDAAVTQVAADPEVTTVFFALAAFPEGANPRLSGVTFGIDYNAEDLVLVSSGRCGDFELSAPDWPAPGSGTALTWSSPRTGLLTELYWFAGYAASSSVPTVFTVTAHPSHGGVFADDSIPSVFDLVSGFGALGFGTSGALPCPGGDGGEGDGPPGGDGPTDQNAGACCASDEACVITDSTSCAATGGTFLGALTTCAPTGCPVPASGQYDYVWRMFAAVDSVLFSVRFPEEAVSALGLDPRVLRIVSSNRKSTHVLVTREGAAALLSAGMAPYVIISPTRQNPEQEDSGSDDPLTPDRDPIYDEDFQYRKVPGAAWTAEDQDASGITSYWGHESTDGSYGICSGYWVEDDGNRTVSPSPCLLYYDTMDGYLATDSMMDGIDLTTAADPSFLMWVRFLPYSGNETMTVGIYDESGAVVVTEVLPTSQAEIEIPCVTGDCELADSERLYIRVHHDVPGSQPQLLSGQVVIEGVYAEGVVHEVRPNLAVTSVTDEAVIGDPFSRDVHVQVRNVGNYAAAQTRVGLLRRGQSYTEQNVEEITDTIVVPPLDWSGTWNGTIRITWGGESGLLLDENYSEWITAVVDPDNWIYESDESFCCDPFTTGGNNFNSRQISWSIPRVPIVLVPGLTASTLDQASVEVWSEDLLTDLLSVSTSNGRVRLNSDETEYNGVPKLGGELIRDLRFPKLLRYLAAIRQPGMMPYEGLLIDENLDPPAVDLFGGLINHLVSQGYELGRDLVLCDYDWRKHAQEIPADPLRQPAADIQQAIVGIKQTFGQDTRVAIVSHSLGSLATLAYFQRMERLSADHSVRNWVSIGAPFAGLPYSIGALGGRLSLVSWIPGGGWPLASKLAETTRNMTAVHSLLPEPDRYTDPVIYEYSVNFPSPLALPAGGQTFDAMMLDYPDWWTIRLTDPAYQRGFGYWAAAYRSYDGIDGMSKIVCNNIPTFGGFIKVDVNLVPSNPFGDVHLDTFWVPWGRGVAGDGIVPLSSASQSAQPMQTLYVNGTHHSKLPVHEGAIETTYELAQGNTPSFLPDGVSTNPQQFGMGHILLFELRKLCGYITGGIDAPDYDIEGMPVALELYDLDSGELVSGCVLPVDQSETPIGPATVLGLDTGMDGFATENQAFLGLTLPQSHSTRNYRLVLVPDPSFCQPGIVTAGESVDDDATFEIGAQLIIRTDFGDWGFPGPGSPSPDWIHFTSLRRFPTDAALGFSAYVDFTITNGRIDQQELPLYYDSDGDGSHDGVVVEVEEEVSNAPINRRLTVLPNPSPGRFRASWGQPVGQGGSVRVIDASGRIIESRSLDPGDVDTDLELSGTVPAGVYFVEITGSSVHERVRVTVVR